MSQVKYPNAYAQLTGQDGNAFNIIAIVRRSIRDAGYGYVDASSFSQAAMDCESYDDLLRFCAETVHVS